jgi:hypothetical protein
MRLRDTRMFCRIQSGSTAFPVVIRERNIKEDSFEALASVCGVPNNLADDLHLHCSWWFRFRPELCI